MVGRDPCNYSSTNFNEKLATVSSVYCLCVIIIIIELAYTQGLIIQYTLLIDA